MESRIVVHPEVENALSEGRPVVALETAVLTHGLPRDEGGSRPRLLGDHSEAAVQARLECWPDGSPEFEWDADRPLNLQVARLVESTVRGLGGVPATVAVIEGRLRIGLDPEQLEELAGRTDVNKCSTRDLGTTIAGRDWGGTTVAGSLAACRAANDMLRDAGLPCLEVFATGGIGGVHRGWNRHRDVSADIRALATTPLATISAGAKVILDLPATREALDTSMIPVMGWRTDRFPMFTAPGLPDHPPIPSFQTFEEVAAACRAHWDVMGRNEGVLIANGIHPGMGLDPIRLEELVRQAILRAEEQDVRGAALTPWLLEELAGNSAGDALDANITLLCSNASVGTRLARALQGG